MSLRLICSVVVITTSLSKLCVLVLCKKCSVNSQLITLPLICIKLHHVVISSSLQTTVYISMAGVTSGLLTIVKTG